MPWWGWIVVGVVLLGAETVVATEFYLAVLGVAALVTGVAMAIGPQDPIWLQWALFGVLSIVFVVFFRRRLHEKLIGETPELGEELVGETVRPGQAMAPGATARVELRGSVWNAQNVGDAPIAADAAARVVRVRGVVLEIRS